MESALRRLWSLLFSFVKPVIFLVASADGPLAPVRPNSKRNESVGLKVTPKGSLWGPSPGY
jgi:hypothetical protein